MIAYLAAMFVVGAVPPEAATATYLAAVRHGVDPYELGGYLISEHGDDWTDDTSKCSVRGACGPFQLMPLWAAEFGYDRDDRADLWASADMAAQLLAYTHESHAECSSSRHGYRAHLKCSRRSRDACDYPVRSWTEFECALRAITGDTPCPVS